MRAFPFTSVLAAAFLAVFLSLLCPSRPAVRSFERTNEMDELKGRRQAARAHSQRAQGAPHLHLGRQEAGLLFWESWSAEYPEKCYDAYDGMQICVLMIRKRTLGPGSYATRPF